MMVFLAILAALWLLCGIICLYHMDFTIDIQNGFKGSVCMIGIVILIFLIGPLMLREVIRHNYPPTP